jgi:hypothetical protein
MQKLALGVFDEVRVQVRDEGLEGAARRCAGEWPAGWAPREVFLALRNERAAAAARICVG